MRVARRGDGTVGTRRRRLPVLVLATLMAAGRLGAQDGSGPGAGTAPPGPVVRDGAAGGGEGTSPAQEAAAGPPPPTLEELAADGLRVEWPRRPLALGEWFVVAAEGDFAPSARLAASEPDPDVVVGAARRETDPVSRRAGRLEMDMAVARVGRRELTGLVLHDGTTSRPLPPLPIEVVLELPPARTPRVADLLDPLALPLPPAPVWPILGASLAALALLLLWVVKSTRPVTVVERRPPADQVAVEALARLRLHLPRAPEEIAGFVVAVSDVLRTYVEGRFAVHAPARTTEEFLHEAAQLSALAERSETLGRFLESCDLVKYARYRPAPAEAEALLETAERFVEETRA